MRSRFFEIANGNVEVIDPFLYLKTRVETKFVTEKFQELDAVNARDT
jgi:hypothetical protein